MPIVPITSIHTTGHEAMLRHLQACTEIAIDCKWYSAHPQHDLCLLQIFAPEAPVGGSILGGVVSFHPATVYLVDRLPTSQVHDSWEDLVEPFPTSLFPLSKSCSVDLLLSLKDVLEAPGTVKVFHDCREVGGFVHSL